MKDGDRCSHRLPLLPILSRRRASGDSGLGFPLGGFAGLLPAGLSFSQEGGLAAAGLPLVGFGAGFVRGRGLGVGAAMIRHPTR